MVFFLYSMIVMLTMGLFFLLDKVNRLLHERNMARINLDYQTKMHELVAKNRDFYKDQLYKTLGITKEYCEKIQKHLGQPVKLDSSLN